MRCAMLKDISLARAGMRRLSRSAKSERPSARPPLAASRSRREPRERRREEVRSKRPGLQRQTRRVRNSSRPVQKSRGGSSLPPNVRSAF